MIKTINKIIEKTKKKIVIIFLAYKKKESPIIAKFFAVMTLAYALSPIDIIPDFIPLIGYLDDIIILPLLIYLSFKFIPKEILIQCTKDAEGIEKKQLPVNKKAGIIIIIIWIVVIYVIASKLIAAKSA